MNDCKSIKELAVMLFKICGRLKISRFFFFFSSRRRHTRYIGDWSSDVCSSDLRLDSSWMVRGVKSGGSVGPTLRLSGATGDRSPAKIGRASCRERVYMSVVAEALNKNTLYK